MNRFPFLLFCCLPFLCGAQFAVSSLVVLQAGDGNNALSGTGNAVVLKEFSQNGLPGISIPVPATGTQALIIRGSSSSEGYLSRTEDGRYLVFGGYRQTLNNTVTLNSSSPSSIARVIAGVDAAGNYQVLATSSVSSISAGDLRAAAGTNSTNVWGNSSSQGTSYYGIGSGATQVQNAKANVRALQVFNNRLYLSSQVSSGTPPDIGVFAIGSSTAVSSAQTVSTIINTGAGSLPAQFYFHPSGTTCYVADSRNVSSGGGIQKWVFGAGTWSLAYTLNTGTVGAFGVVANFTGIKPIVYATTTEASNNRLVAIRDTGAASGFTTLASSGSANTVFRGLSFAPLSGSCSPVFINNMVNSSPACANQSISLQSNVSGSPPLSYTWTQPVSNVSVNSASVVLSNAVPGLYTLALANACGTAVAVTQVTAYPVPSLQVSASTLCVGHVHTLTALGASSYTWSSALTGTLTGNSPTVSPGITTIYTVQGSNAQACVSTSSLQVFVISGFSLQLAGDTICAGQTASIYASGANSYTWNNGINSPSLSVSPSITTQYIVIGGMPGCTITAVDSVKVMVHQNPSPLLLIPEVVCLHQDSVLLQGSPPGGNFGGTGVLGVYWHPPAIGSFQLNYSYTDSNACSGYTQKMVLVSLCAGVRANSSGFRLRIYPNPVSRTLSIESIGVGRRLLELVNSLGETLDCCWLENGKAELDMSGRPAGVYLLVDKEEGQRLRFIKQ